MTIENGKPYTEIDHDMLEALTLINITKRKLKIMLTMIRLTNGFHKKEDKVPLSQFYERTGIAKGNNSKPLNELIDENMILKKDNLLSIQTDVTKWEGVIKLITLKRLSKRQLKVFKIITKKVINLDPSKETLKAKSKEKVLSKTKEKKRLEKNLEKVHGLLVNIGNMPGLKK